MTEALPRKFTLQELMWLLAGLGMAALPHSLHIPVWIISLFFMLATWRLWDAIKSRSVPENKYASLQRIFQLIIMIGGFVGTYIHFGTLAGRDAGVSLLVMLSGFKILETRSVRDFYITNFLGYFLIITNFFYTQSLVTASYMVITLLVLTSCLITFNDNEQFMSDLRRVRYAGILLLQALPVMLALFFLFPRINGPLWGLPKDAHTGMVGISDTMEPGAISQLVLSDAVAFRVKWEDDPPPRSTLYWRGPVLWHTDGYRWTQGEKSDEKPLTLSTSGKPIKYTVTMEPNNSHWLFALEMPVTIPAQGKLTSDFQILSKEPVRKPIRYTLSSNSDFRVGAMNHKELYRALQFPEDRHQKTIQLAHSWNEEKLSPLQTIDRALRWFNEDEFYYTLTPPLLSQDNVDDFLFKTKKGFCEHYAGAFVTLMRAAGIPARVVTGYQGGTFNPVGNYMIVYQRNAHAWAEVWLENKGWLRVDPTAAVSPERINQGIESALPERNFDVPFIISQNTFIRNLWQGFQNSWDAINNQWNQWIISYGPQRQLQLFRQFGVDNIDWQKMSVVLFFTVGAIMIIIYSLLFIQKPKPINPAKKLYEKFCRKLARKGVERQPSEGPLDFANRAINKYSELKTPIENITELYIAVRYGPQNILFDSLKKNINSFKP